MADVQYADSVIDEQVRRRTRSWMTGDRAALLALTIMLGLVIANRVIWDGWLARHDILTAYMPWYRYLGDRLRHLQVPAWNPYQFSGTPFAGDPNSGWMMWAAMIPFALLNPLNAFKVFVAIELLVAALSSYALARVFGLRPVAALMAAVIYAFGPLSYTTVYCCSVRSNLAAWLPMTFLGIELAFRATTRSTRLGAIALGGFGYSQILAGFLGQGAYDASLLIACFVVYRGLVSPVALLPIRKRLSTSMIAGGGVAVAGAALNAAALLPRLTVSAETNLGSGDYDRLAGYHYGATSLTQWVIGVLIDDFNYRRNTIPAAGIVLGIAGILLVGRKYAAPFWFGMTVVVMGLVVKGSPFPDIIGVLPKWLELHNHQVPQTTAVLMIGPAMLAAIAVHRLSDDTPIKNAGLLIVPLIVLIAVAVFLDRFSINAALAALLTTAVMLLLSHRRRFRPRAMRLLPAALVCIAFIQPMGLELVDAAAGTHLVSGWSEAWHPTTLDEASPAISMSTTDPGGAGEFLQQALERDGPFRYVGYGGTGYVGEPSRPGTYTERRSWPQTLAILVNGRSISLGIYDMQGYNPMQLARYTDYMAQLNGFVEDYHNADLRPFRASDVDLLDMLNVKYFVVDRELPTTRSDVALLTEHAHEVFRDDRVVIYQNDNVLPHAWIVHQVSEVNEETAFATLRSDSFDPAVKALIEQPAPSMQALPNDAAESVDVTTYEPERIDLQVNAAADGLAVISEVYAKGWTATVDGKSAKVYAVDGVLRGVAVPAGEHTVSLRYDPLSLRAGLWISIVSHIAMIASFAWVGWRYLMPRLALNVPGRTP